MRMKQLFAHRSLHSRDHFDRCCSHFIQVGFEPLGPPSLSLSSNRKYPSEV